MDDGNSIVEVTKFVVSNVEKLDDVVDDALSSITDYTDTVGDLLAPIKSLLKIYSLAKKIKFKSFLKSYASNINESMDICENDFDKLRKYVSDQRNLEFIADIIDNAINSKSTLCSAILGYYAGSILSKSKVVENKDFIIINALKIMSDYDVDNFLKLHDFIVTEYRRHPERIFFRIHDMKKTNEIGVESFDLELTIEKLKSVQAIGYEVGGLNNVGNAWGAFKFNDITYYLHEIIKKNML